MSSIGRNRARLTLEPSIKVSKLSVCLFTLVEHWLILWVGLLSPRLSAVSGGLGGKEALKMKCSQEPARDVHRVVLPMGQALCQAHLSLETTSKSHCFLATSIVSLTLYGISGGMHKAAGGRRTTFRSTSHIDSSQGIHLQEQNVLLFFSENVGKNYVSWYCVPLLPHLHIPPFQHGQTKQKKKKISTHNGATSISDQFLLL